MEMSVSATITGTDASGTTRLLTAHGEVRLRAPAPLRTGSVVTLQILPAAAERGAASPAGASGRALLILPAAADRSGVLASDGRSLGSGRTAMATDGRQASDPAQAAKPGMASQPTDPGRTPAPTSPVPTPKATQSAPASPTAGKAGPQGGAAPAAGRTTNQPEPLQPQARSPLPARSLAQADPSHIRAPERMPASGEARSLTTLLQAQSDRPAASPAGRPIAGAVGRFATGFGAPPLWASYSAGDAAGTGANDPLPSLRQTLTALAQVQPGLAEQVVRSLIPQPNAALPATVLLFLSALRGGDVRSWLGDRVERALETAGRSDLLGRLAGDFAGLSRQGGEAQQPMSDWRSFSLPFLDDGALSAIRISLGRSDEDGAADGEADEQGGTRFLIDLALSRLGPMQLDGTLRSQSLALIVRSHRTLPLALRRELGEVLDGACGAIGLSAGLTFQAGPTTFQHPPQQAI